MPPEISAVVQMAEGMKAAGMPDKQADAVLSAISNGIRTYSVTHEVLQEEIAPIKDQLRELWSQVASLKTRMDSLEDRLGELRMEVHDLGKKVDAGFEAINARIFWLIVALLGTMSAMMAAMISVLVTNAGA